MAKQEVQVKFSLIDGVSAGLKGIAGTLGQVGKSLLAITGIAAGATAALGAIGAGVSFSKAVESAAEFEVSLDRIQSAANATAEQMVEVKATIEDAAAGASKSVDQAAAAYERLTREGFNLQQAQKALPAVLNLSTAALLEEAEAAGLVADTLDQFQLSADQAGRVADVLAAGAIKGGTGVKDMADALRQAGPVASQAKLSFEQTAAAIALLAQNGIEGRKAGQALVQIFDALNDPSTRLRKELGDLGITSTDFGTVLTQLAGKGDKAKGAFNALSAQGGAALAKLVGEGGAGLRVLVGDLQNVEGAAANAASIINDNLKTAFVAFQNSLSDLGRKFVEPLLGPLTDELQSAEVAIRQFADSEAFKQLSKAATHLFVDAIEGVKNFVGSFDFKGAAEGLTKFATDAKQTAGDVAKAFRDMADAINSVGNVFGGIGDAAKTAFSSALSSTTQVTGDFLALFSKLTAVAPAVSDALERNAVSLREVAEAARDASGEALASLNARLGGVKVEAVDVAAALADVTAETSSAADGARDLADAGAGAEHALKRQQEALAGYGRAAETSGGQVVKLAANLADLRGIFTALQASGAPAELLGGLETAIGAVEAKLRAAKAAATETGAAVTDNAKQQEEWAKQTRERAQQAIDAQKGVTDAVQETTTATAELGTAAEQTSTQTAGAMGGIVSILQGLNTFWGKTSQNARQFFVDMFNQAVRTATSLEAVGKAIERADAATRKAVEGQRAAAEGAIRTYQQLAETGEAAGQSLEQAPERAAKQLRIMANAAREGLNSLKLLDQATLDNLGAALDAAADKADQLAQRARDAADELLDINERLQDELDEAAGNREAIEERRHQKALARIRELAEQGDAEAKRLAQEAEVRENQAHQRRLDEIRDEADAQLAGEDEVERRQARRRAGAAGGFDLGPTAVEEADERDQLDERNHQNRLRRMRLEADAQLAMEDEIARIRAARSFALSEGAVPADAAPPQRPQAPINLTINVHSAVAADINELARKLRDPIERELRGIEFLRR